MVDSARTWGDYGRSERHSALNGSQPHALVVAISRVEQQGAPSTTEQSQRAAKSPRWDGLTFDTKGEIIISSSGSQLYPAEA